MYPSSPSPLGPLTSPPLYTLYILVPECSTFLVSPLASVPSPFPPGFPTGPYLLTPLCTAPLPSDHWFLVFPLPLTYPIFKAWTLPLFLSLSLDSLCLARINLFHGTSIQRSFPAFCRRPSSGLQLSSVCVSYACVPALPSDSPLETLPEGHGISPPTPPRHVKAGD